MAKSRVIAAGQRTDAPRLRPQRQTAAAACGIRNRTYPRRPAPSLQQTRGQAIVASAAGTAKDDKTGRAVMLREKEGAPITVLEPANYWSIKTDDYEFLIAEKDGKMNLSTSFIVDDFTGISSRPVVGDGVPDKFLAYLEVPWMEMDTGDLIMDKKPSEKIPRYYYLEAKGEKDLNIEAAYVFHVEERSITRVEVEMGEGWDEEDAYLRFMDNGRIVMQSTASTPTPEQLVSERYAQFIREGGEGGSPVVREEMEEEDEEIEFDLDVPDVDMS